MTSASYYRLLANHRPVDGDDAKDTAHSAGGQGRQRRRLVRDANDASPGRRAGDAAAAAARAFVATESSMPGGCNCHLEMSKDQRSWYDHAYGPAHSYWTVTRGDRWDDEAHSR